MTATPDTAPTVNIDVPISLPLEDGGTLRVRQGISAIRTETEGLVVFPALLGLFDIDDQVWHVTHIGTGLRIPVTFPGQEHATAFANAAGPLACWWQKRPDLPMDVHLKLVALAQEHGGTPDQKVVDALARRQAKETE